VIKLIIFWHHVGREHGKNGYAADIKKNSEETIENCLLQKRNFAENINRNQFIRYNETTLLELPPKDSEKEFVIVYCLDKGLQYSLGNKDYPFWLIDICDIEEVEKNVFCVHDLFIDISVNEDTSYNVLDMDDFHFAIENKVIDYETTRKALHSLSIALEELNNNAFPNPLLLEIENHYIKTK